MLYLINNVTIQGFLSDINPVAKRAISFKIKKSVIGTPSIMRHLPGVVNKKLSVTQKIIVLPMKAILRKHTKRVPKIKENPIIISTIPIKLDTP